MPSPGATGRVTAAFGPRKTRPTPTSPLFHYGVDRIGTGNYSNVTGTVEWVGYRGALGNVICVREAANPSVSWQQMHNANLNGRAPGQKVREKEFLAPLGTTGNVTGPHLHNERRVGGGALPQSGTATNPEQHYSGTAGGGVTPIPEKEDEDMPIFELRQDPQNTVWWCKDRTVRFAVPAPTNLTDYIYFGKQLGQDMTIHRQASMDSFGTPVYRNGVPAINLGGLATMSAQALADLTAKAVASVKIRRGGKEISWLQDSADGTTKAEHADKLAQAILDELREVKPVELTLSDAQLDALAAKIPDPDFDGAAILAQLGEVHAIRFDQLDAEIAALPAKAGAAARDAIVRPAS